MALVGVAAATLVPALALSVPIPSPRELPSWRRRQNLPLHPRLLWRPSAQRGKNQWTHMRSSLRRITPSLMQWTLPRRYHGSVPMRRRGTTLLWLDRYLSFWSGASLDVRLPYLPLLLPSDLCLLAPPMSSKPDTRENFPPWHRQPHPPCQAARSARMATSLKPSSRPSKSEGRNFSMGGPRARLQASPGEGFQSFFAFQDSIFWSLQWSK